MLLVTRRIHQTILIGQDISITIFDIRGDSVRLGIQMPRSITLCLGEEWEERQRQEESREEER